MTDQEFCVLRTPERYRFQGTCQPDIFFLIDYFRRPYETPSRGSFGSFLTRVPGHLSLSAPPHVYEMAMMLVCPRALLFLYGLARLD